MEPLILFILTGFVAMAGALAAGAINKLPEDQKPEWAATRKGMTMIVMAGNLAAITLVGAGAYGFKHLDWWVPLSCIFITFPVVYLVLFQKVLGDLKSLFLMTPLVVVAAGALVYFW